MGRCGPADGCQARVSAGSPQHRPSVAAGQLAHLHLCPALAVGRVNVLAEEAGRGGAVSASMARCGRAHSAPGDSSAPPGGRRGTCRPRRSGPCPAGPGPRALWSGGSGGRGAQPPWPLRPGASTEPCSDRPPRGRQDTRRRRDSPWVRGRAVGRFRPALDGRESGGRLRPLPRTPPRPEWAASHIGRPRAEGDPQAGVQTGLRRGWELGALTPALRQLCRIGLGGCPGGGRESVSPQVLLPRPSWLQPLPTRCPACS